MNSVRDDGDVCARAEGDGGDPFAGHTPGPWSVRTPDLNIITHAQCVPAVLGHIADVRGYVGVDEAHANARLMAAAPDLLAERDKLRAEVERLRRFIRSVASAMSHGSVREADYRDTLDQEDFDGGLVHDGDFWRLDPDLAHEWLLMCRAALAEGGAATDILDERDRLRADLNYSLGVQMETRAVARRMADAIRDVLPDLENYASRQGPGPDRRLAALRGALGAFCGLSVDGGAA